MVRVMAAMRSLFVTARSRHALEIGTETPHAQLALGRDRDGQLFLSRGNVGDFPSSDAAIGQHGEAEACGKTIMAIEADGNSWLLWNERVSGAVITASIMTFRAAISLLRDAVLQRGVSMSVLRRNGPVLG